MREKNLIWATVLASLLCFFIETSAMYAQDSVSRSMNIGGSLDISELLNRYESARSNQKNLIGDSILSAIYTLDMMDEPIRISSSMPADSVDMLVYHYSAWYYFENEEWKQAVDYLNKCIVLAEKYGDELFLSDTYHNAGLNYFRLGDFEKSAHYFSLTYELDKKSGDVSRMCNTLNCIAGTYLANKQPTVAEPYILDAINLNATIDEPERMSVYFGTASEIYHQMGNELRAKQYAEKGLQIERQLGRKGQTGKRLCQLAAAYIGLGQLSDAKAALVEAMPLLSEGGMTHSIGICETQLGDICLREGDMSEAARHYHTAIDIFYEQGDIYNEARAQQGLYNALRDSFPQKALIQLERYNALKDSIYTKETQAAISKYNAEYGNDRLQNDIRKAEYKHRVNIVFGILSLLLVLAMVFIILLTQRNRHLNRKKELQQEIDTLQQQNEQLNTWYQNALQSKKPETDMSENDKRFLEKLVDTIDHKLEDGGADVEAISSQMRMTPQQLRTRLNDLLDETPRSYILKVRMEKARYMLESDTTMPIAEVAMHCGYDEPSNFVHAFRKFYGITPSELRKKQ